MTPYIIQSRLERIAIHHYLGSLLSSNRSIVVYRNSCHTPGTFDEKRSIGIATQFDEKRLIGIATQFDALTAIVILR